ncbi:hypothetical protein CC2G_007670 [Coprinopsis cinerea AmutBmut pab1-1]|nr:hypothetical protein CC2G_007670 [Coprinopsis cinerea AmutBmut pab1-1]
MQEAQLHWQSIVRSPTSKLQGDVTHHTVGLPYRKFVYYDAVKGDIGSFRGFWHYESGPQENLPRMREGLFSWGNLPFYCEDSRHSRTKFVLRVQGSTLKKRR